MGTKLLFRLHEYWRLMRFDRPIGIYLLLWPTLWGLWYVGRGEPLASIVVIFCLGVILMRAAGCVINDIADRNFDAHVKRTQTRPLAAKTIAVWEAVIILIGLLLMSGYLALFLNQLTLYLALIAGILAVSYPYMKRFHDLPQAHLGLAFSFGIPMSATALNHPLNGMIFLLMVINIIWTLIYDTAYAMSDRDDDRDLALKSSALLFEHWLGRHDYLIVLGLQIMMLGLLVLFGQLANFGVYWYLMLSGVGLCSIRQIYLIQSHQRHCCFQAFLENHYVGLMIFIGFVLSYLPDKI